MRPAARRWMLKQVQHDGGETQGATCARLAALAPSKPVVGAGDGVILIGEAEARSRRLGVAQRFGPIPLFLRADP